MGGFCVELERLGAGYLSGRTWAFPATPACGVFGDERRKHRARATSAALSESHLQPAAGKYRALVRADNDIRRRWMHSVADSEILRRYIRHARARRSRVANRSSSVSDRS